MPEATLVPFRLDETPHFVGFRLKVLPLAQLNRRLAHIQLGQPGFIHCFELATFFERFDHGGWTNLQYSGCIPDATAIQGHIGDLLLHVR